MYNRFIHIFDIPKTPKVFLEVMNYTLNSFVGDFINFEDDDILLYNKSLTSKFSKRNLSSIKFDDCELKKVFSTSYMKIQDYSDTSDQIVFDEPIHDFLFENSSK